MHTVFERNHFFIREGVQPLKAGHTYTVLASENGERLLRCSEPELGMVTRLLRFTRYKTYTPFDVRLYDPEGQLLLSLRRGPALLRSLVAVHDAQDRVIGYFRQKLLSLGGSFEVLNPREEVVSKLQGEWRGGNYVFQKNGRQLAQVRKNFAGLAKELLTSADHYTLDIDAGLSPADPMRPMLLAAVICIDMVLKNR